MNALAPGLNVLRLRKLLNAARHRRLSVAALEHLHLRRLPIQFVIDVGANRGQFSVLMRDCFPGVRIDAFEPLERPGRALRRVFGSCPQVRIYDLALSEHCGDAPIHVSKRDDSSSLLPIGQLQNSIFRGTEESHVETVSIATLASIYTSPERVSPNTLIKIDTQGTELQVLRGGAQVLPFIRWIYVEASYVELYSGQSLASEVMAYLIEHGFTLSGVYNSCYENNGRAVQADFLFENRLVNK